MWSCKKNSDKLIRLSLMLTLVIIYYFGYLKDTITTYQKKRTLMSSRTENVSKREAPAITICNDFGFKPSVEAKYMQDREIKHAFTRNINLPSALKDLNPKDVYQEATYELGRDWFVPRFKVQGAIMTKINNIASQDNGYCLNFEVHGTAVSKIAVYIALSNELKEEDVPLNLDVYVTSKALTQRLIIGSWAEYKPMILTVPLNNGFRQHNILLEAAETTFLHGNANCTGDCLFSDCYFGSEIMQKIKANCSKPCFPINREGLISNITDLEICSDFESHQCTNPIVRKYILDKRDGHCFISKSTLTYSGFTRNLPVHERFFNGSKIGASFIFTFATKETITEEVLVHDFKDLVGNVGGALGLFIGFSFYDYIITGIHFLVDRFCRA